jgi:hypothetical protein
MATIYYPSNATVYTRNVNSYLTEQIIGLTPDTIFVFTTGSLGFTSSIFYGNSASYASSSISSSYTLTASYALNGGGGNSLSASWASQSLSASYASSSVSSSYTLTASYALNGGGGGGGNSLSASWASQSLSASYLIGSTSTTSTTSIKSPIRQWFGPSGIAIAGNGLSTFGDAFIVSNGSKWVLYYFATSASPPYVSTYYMTSSLLESGWSTSNVLSSLNSYHKFVLAVDESGVPQNIGGNYHGYGVYYNGSISDKEIFHFTCPSLTGSWTLGSKVIAKGTGGSLDEFSTDTPYAIYKNGLYYIWYMGAPNSSLPTYGYGERMLMASSSNADGPFVKGYVDVLTMGTAGAWDYGWLGGTQIRLCPDGTYMMVYNAGNNRPVASGVEPNSSSIGYAYATSILGPWTKDSANPYCSPVGTPSDGGQSLENTNIWRGHMQYDTTMNSWYMFYNVGANGIEKITFARAGIYDYFDAHAGNPYLIQSITTGILPVSNSRVNLTPGAYRVCYQYNVGDLSTNKPAVDIDTALRVNGTPIKTNRDFVGSYNYENRDTLLNYVITIPTSSYIDCSVQCTNGTPSSQTQLRRLRVNVQKIW